MGFRPIAIWPENGWMGVSVEDERVVHRINSLRQTGAFIKFRSLEPLIGPLPNLNLHGIDGVIAGGESGPKARPMKESWVTDIRDQCYPATFPSSSSSRVGCIMKRMDGYWKEGRMMGCRGEGNEVEM